MRRLLLEAQAIDAISASAAGAARALAALSRTEAPLHHCLSTPHAQQLLLPLVFTRGFAFGSRRGPRQRPGPPQLRGIPARLVRLEDVHLVPVTGEDGRNGARTPYVNVRAACAPRERAWRDKSPW